MARAQEMGTPVDWLVRAIHNRKVVGEQDKLWNGFGDEHDLGDIRFPLAARQGVAAREVTQRLRARQIHHSLRQGRAH